MMRKEQLPWMMAAGRMALGPVMMIGQRCGWNGVTLAAMVVAALVSDIFDGVLARRWARDTNGVRLFDSMADTVFYVCTGIALWMRRPELFRANAVLLLAVLLFEAGRYAFDFAKFGKPASYHSYLAKTWGLLLASAIVSAFLNAHGGMLFAAALWLGIACNVEGLAMSLMLREWRKDVKTFSAAMRIRMMDSVSLSERAKEVFRASEKKRSFVDKLVPPFLTKLLRERTNMTNRGDTICH
jgi:phosphatidylglycerophosphate synthase